MLDKSKDGYICVHEIEDSMQEFVGDFTAIIGRDPNWKSIINSLDANQDGKLDFNEFMAAATDRVNLLNEENLKKAFSILDKNNDGKVSATELKETFAAGVFNPGNGRTQLDDAFWKKMLSECDINGDGFIDFKEFKATMT